MLKAMMLNKVSAFQTQLLVLENNCVDEIYFIVLK